METASEDAEGFVAVGFLLPEDLTLGKVQTACGSPRSVRSRQDVAGAAAVAFASPPSQNQLKLGLGSHVGR